LSAAQGRRFGLTVGGAFAVLAAITWWRGHELPMYAFGFLGSVLVLAGLIVPTYLGPVERAWMALAHAISKVTTPIVMSVLYFLVLTPVGMIRRTIAGNSLVHQEAVSGFWKQRQAGSRRSSMERQF
jgi:hypothetical protein